MIFVLPGMGADSSMFTGSGHLIAMTHARECCDFVAASL
ncbi:hypothetical protein RAHE111665_04270 [Rariglobus hedericola]